MTTMTKPIWIIIGVLVALCFLWLISEKLSCNSNKDGIEIEMRK